MGATLLVECIRLVNVHKSAQALFGERGKPGSD